MDFDECDRSPEGHLVSDGEYVCDRCEADQCPICKAWFPDYETFLEHVETE